MFTGIVEFLGTVVGVSEADRGRRLVIDVGPLSDGIQVGDSIALNGTCLTADSIAGSLVEFFAVGETLDRTNIGDVSSGDRINLERPLSASGRFDGHIVQGHVDGVGTLRSITPDGDSRRLWIDVPAHLLRYVVEKGSITVDGASLTVTSFDDAGFEVALIPHTLSATTLGLRHTGDRVNLEVDVLAKYVERLIGAAP